VIVYLHRALNIYKMMLYRLLKIAESPMTSISMNDENVRERIFDTASINSEISSLADESLPARTGVLESVRASYEYYSSERTVEKYGLGPEKLSKHFAAEVHHKIKQEKWSEESVSLIDAVHWSENICFKDFPTGGDKRSVVKLALSRAGVGTDSEMRDNCVLMHVTRSSTFEWWNAYNIWKNHNSERITLADPGEHEAFRKRFLESGVDEEGQNQKTKVLRIDSRGDIVEKTLYPKEVFIVEKHTQRAFLQALFELYNFIHCRIVPQLSDWQKGNEEERELLLQKDSDYFLDLLEICNNIKFAYKSKMSDDEAAAPAPRQVQRVTAFQMFCQEHKDSAKESGKSRKALGIEFRALSKEEKDHYKSERKNNKLKTETGKTKPVKDDSAADSWSEDSDSEVSNVSEASKSKSEEVFKAKRKGISSKESGHSAPRESGILVGMTLERVGKELNDFFNSDMLHDDEKKFAWNACFANMTRASKRQKTTAFTDTVFDKLKNNQDCKQNDDQLKLLRTSFQTFNVIFSTPSEEETDTDFIV